MSGAAAVAPPTAGVTITTVSKHLRTSRGLGRVLLDRQPDCQAEIAQRRVIALHALTQPEHRRAGGDDRAVLARRGVLDEDRKSTRLNSSHRTISYAVFCLKK